MAANYISTGGAELLKKSTTYFAEQGTVPSSTETDIVSVTIPSGKTGIVLNGSGQAKVDVIFRLYIDGSRKEIRRNAWTGRVVDFTSNEAVEAGLVVKITAEHTNLLAQSISASLSLAIL